jgi:hypothetical protein
MIDAITLSWQAATADVTGLRLPYPPSYEVAVLPRGATTPTLIEINGTTYSYKIPDKRRCYRFTIRTVFNGKFSDPVTLPEYKLVDGQPKQCTAVK